MPTNVVLTGVGRDRVGIVAELSNVLFELGCNLLDSSMTLLRGEFAVILMAQIPEDSTLEELKEKLADVEKSLEMNVYLRELSDQELAQSEQEETAYIISVYGADRPGIVAGITKELAELKVNLTDVETKKTESAKSLFLMVLEITIPSDLTYETLESRLKNRAESLGVDVSIQAVEYMEI